MSVDILITSLRSWEMMRFCCLSHLVRLWSFITAALVAPQHPRNSSQERPERPTLPARVEQATLCAVGCSEKHQGEGQPARGDLASVVFLWGGAAQEWGVWRRQDGTSLVAQRLGLWALPAGVWIQSLVEELRSCMPCRVTKINK